MEHSIAEFPHEGALDKKKVQQIIVLLISLEEKQ